MFKLVYNFVATKILSLYICRRITYKFVAPTYNYVAHKFLITLIIN